MPIMPPVYFRHAFPHAATRLLAFAATLFFALVFFSLLFISMPTPCAAPPYLYDRLFTAAVTLIIY